MVDEKEEKTPEESKEEVKDEAETAPDNAEGKPVDTQEPSLIEKAEQAAERIEKANKTFADNLEKLEELKARDALGGRTIAGQQPEKTKEMTDVEYSEALLNGKIQFKDEK